MTQPATPKELYPLVSRSDPSLTTTLRDAGEVDPETRLNAIRDLLLNGLVPLRDELDTVLTVVLAKMKRVRKIALLGAVVAALSGLVMAVTTALDLGQDWHKVIAAGFASFGGLAVVFSDYFQMAPNGRRIA